MQEQSKKQYVYKGARYFENSRSLNRETNVGAENSRIKQSLQHNKKYLLHLSGQCQCQKIPTGKIQCETSRQGLMLLTKHRYKCNQLDESKSTYNIVLNCTTIPGPQQTKCQFPVIIDDQTKYIKQPSHKDKKIKNYLYIMGLNMNQQ